MSSPSRCGVLLFIASLALTGVGRAQVLTADTLGASQASFYPENFTFTQTFSQVSQIESLTFRLLAGSNDFSASTLNYYFSEWNPITGLATGTALAQGTLDIDAGAAWQHAAIYSGVYNYFDATLDLSSVASGLTPSATYAISFYGSMTGVPGGVYAPGLALSSSLYADGGTFILDPSVTDGSQLTTNASGNYAGNYDLLFSAGPSSLSPVPEAGTTAVVLAGLFVSGLVGWQIRQRRRAVGVSADVV
ncbi:hypothetical protein K0B96_00165 [Horticoccus luteus]|uniref:Secreted protein with PEP-CTERM sorting signal n=1 Tax=Horticoccus luteus TaxID=2862869 RepID=A0A8F9TTN9_9BACT|nr:hypothetical protein [Horticoccus luteus]QYM79064.1 hypothetical protein K0B96_00165 [Horticoccus luteus]